MTFQPNKLVDAWKRLDRALSETTQVRVRQRLKSAHGQRIDSLHRQNTQQNNSIDNDMYITMCPGSQDEQIYHPRRKSTRTRVPNSQKFELLESQLLQQSLMSDMNNTTQIGGCVAQAIRSVVTVKAYDRPSFVQHKQMKRIHQQKMHLDILGLSVEKISTVIMKTEKIHKIDIDLIFELYSAKCNDNQINYVPEQAIKFVNRFKRVCGKGIINLNNQNLGPNSAKIMGKMIALSSKMIQLDLSGNILSEQSALLLSQGLVKNVSIIHLNISHCSLSSNSIRILLIYLPKTLISLNLSSNRQNQQGVVFLGDFIKTNKIIQILTLKDIGCTIKYLSEGLKLSESLISLNLENNPIEHLSTSFITSLTIIQTLEELNLYNTQLGDLGVEILSQSIKKSFHLNLWNVVILKLDKCSFTNYGFQKVVEAIYQTCIEEFTVSKNNFADMSFLTIAQQLFQSRTLNRIDLSECQLHSQSSVGLAQMLKCYSLKSVNISGNHFNLEHSKGLSCGIKFIQKLNISKCRLGSKGAQILLPHLEGNQYMTDLNISDNFISDEVFLQFLQILQKNKLLLKVDISRNQYTFKTLESINILLMNNFRYQEEQKIPKIKQQMLELQSIYQQKEIVDTESLLIFNKKEEILERYDLEVINKEQLIEKEFIKTERLKKKQEVQKDEFDDLNSSYHVCHHVQQEQIGGMESSYSQYEKELKEMNQSIKELKKIMMQLQDSIQPTQINLSKRLESLKIEESSRRRKLNQVNSIYNTQLDLYEKALSKVNLDTSKSISPKKRIQDSKKQTKIEK